MALIRRRTHCRVEGHGTRCVVAHERSGEGRYERCTEENLAMELERDAHALRGDWHRVLGDWDPGE